MLSADAVNHLSMSRICSAMRVCWASAGFDPSQLAKANRMMSLPTQWCQVASRQPSLFSERLRLFIRDIALYAVKPPLSGGEPSTALNS
jgi:hypothetical protein